MRVLPRFNWGYLNVVAPLYLISLGVSAAGLGVLATPSYLFGAVPSVAAGFAADRYRRKPFPRVARLVFSQRITPVRQSFTMGLVSSEERR